MSSGLHVPLFYMSYFGCQGHSWNEATRRLSELLLHLGSKGLSEPPHCVQAKPYKAFNSASLQMFFGHTVFLKLVSGCFSDTETRYPTWKLKVQNIKCIERKIFRSLKEIFVSKFLQIILFIFSIKYTKVFFGCPYRSSGTKT